MARHVTVFFIWQSDHRRTYNGGWHALEEAAKRLNEQSSEFVFAADRDTRNVSGAVPIDHVILEKIRRADVVVADLTPIVQLEKGSRTKSIPNPNVMFELGVAREAVGLERIILFRDDKVPWHPPFDIQQLRMARYKGEAKFRDELMEILPAMVAMRSPIGLSNDQAVSLYRTLWGGPKVQSNPDLRAEIALELDLLSTRADDTFARLAHRFRSERPWDRPGWPMSRDVHTVLHGLLSEAIHPQRSTSDRFAAWNELENLMAMIPLHEERQRLVALAEDWGWSGRSLPDLDELDEWLAQARGCGGDTDALQRLAVQIRASLARNMGAVREPLRLMVEDFKAESPADLRERLKERSAVADE